MITDNQAPDTKYFSYKKQPVIYLTENSSTLVEKVLDKLLRL